MMPRTPIRAALLQRPRGYATSWIRLLNFLPPYRRNTRDFALDRRAGSTMVERSLADSDAG
jgi:hypothetical protein